MIGLEYLIRWQGTLLLSRAHGQLCYYPSQLRRKFFGNVFTQLAIRPNERKNYTSCTNMLIIARF
jgi:hypothetical protein